VVTFIACGVRSGSTSVFACCLFLDVSARLKTVGNGASRQCPGQKQPRLDSFIITPGPLEHHIAVTGGGGGEINNFPRLLSHSTKIPLAVPAIFVIDLNEINSLRSGSRKAKRRVCLLKLPPPKVIAEIGQYQFAA